VWTYALDFSSVLDLETFPQFFGVGNIACTADAILILQQRLNSDVMNVGSIESAFCTGFPSGAPAGVATDLIDGSSPESGLHISNDVSPENWRNNCNLC
jgi:hypothetical protein